MTTFVHEAHKTKWIAVKNLSIVWSSAQREFNPAHASAIAANFDPDMFGTLSVTLPNGDGIYHVIDGQHRKAAIQQLFGENETVPCNVFNADDPKRAAEIFDRINTSRKSPRPVDRFRVRVTAQRPDECAVARTANLRGYKIGPQSDTGIIRAVDALMWVYKQFSQSVLGETLDIIKETFGMDHHAVDASLIRGYGTFVAEFGSRMNRSRLIETVQKQYTPGRLVGAARTAREVNRTNLADGVRFMLLTTYNKGLRTPLKEEEPAKSSTITKKAA